MWEKNPSIVTQEVSDTIIKQFGIEFVVAEGKPMRTRKDLIRSNL